MKAGRRAVAAVALAGVVLVPACSSKPAPQVSGVIVEKDHDKGTCRSSTVKLSSYSPAQAGPVIVAPKPAPVIPKAPAAPRPAAPKPVPAPKPPATPRAVPPVVPPTPTCKADEWEFDIREADGDVIEIDVSRAEFDRYRVGDRYPR